MTPMNKRAQAQLSISLKYTMVEYTAGL